MLSRIKELFGFGDSNGEGNSFHSGGSAGGSVAGRAGGLDGSNGLGGAHNNGYTRDANGNINEPVQIRYESGDGRDSKSIPEMIVGGAFGFMSAAIGKAFKGIAGFFATIIAIMALGFILIEFFASPIMLNFSGISHGVSFNLPNQYGEMVSSQSLIGEPYVLFFGSSNCSDCIAQRSQLKEIEKSGIKVIGVLPSIDAKNPEYAAFYSSMFTSVLMDENDSLFNGMSMVILPNMLVMNGNGEPIYDAMKSISNNDVDKITRMFEQYKKAHPDAYVAPMPAPALTAAGEGASDGGIVSDEQRESIGGGASSQQLSENNVNLIVNDVVLESEASSTSKAAVKANGNNESGANGFNGANGVSGANGVNDGAKNAKK